MTPDPDSNTDELKYRFLIGSTLKEREELRRIALSTSRKGSFDWYPLENIMHWDERLHEVFGIPLDFGQDRNQYFSSILHPEDKQKFQQEIAKLLTQDISQKTYHLGYRVIVSGQIKYIQSSGFLLHDSSGAVYRIIGTSEDITEKIRSSQILQEREAFLQTIFDHSLNAIMVADDEGNYLTVNPASAQLFGYPMEQLSRMNVRELKTTDLRDSQTQYNDYLEKGKEIGEFSFIRSDGAYRIAQYYAIRVGKDFNLSILADITERTLAEKQKIRARQIELRNKELEQFAYIASHDLKEPLRTIMSFTGLLKIRLGNNLNPEINELLEFIYQAGDRMEKLIKGLLEYSNIGINNNLTEIDTHILVQQVLRNLETQISASNATIETHDLPIVKGYETELFILFQNLISNAIKFRNQEIDPVIRISAKKEADQWAFCITDNGIGIEPQYHKKIFVIFQRLHAAHEYEGSGIGLAHCQKIIDLHGGEIWVESEYGKGSAFYFTISAFIENYES